MVTLRRTTPPNRHALARYPGLALCACLLLSACAVSAAPQPASASVPNLPTK